MTASRAAGTLCLVAWSLAIGASRATAQADPIPGPDTTASTVSGPGHPAASRRDWLAPDHWSRVALRWLAARGDLPTSVASLTWPARRGLVRDMLADAADRNPLAAHWLEALDAGSGRAFGPVSISAAAGLDAGDGRLATGSIDSTSAGIAYSGPHQLDEYTHLFGEIRAALAIGDRSGADFTLRTLPDSAVKVGRATLGAQIGAIELWAGRREAGFGPSADGLVLSGRTLFDGGGLDTPAGFGLPGFLKGLGTFRISQVIARFDRSGDIRNPWFVATRVSIEPSPSLTIGVNRAALFGGTGNEPVTVGRLFLVLFGITDSRGKDSDFENQVASLDVAWNAGGVLLWAEYGFDDAGPSFLLVPGITVGALWDGPTPSLALGGSVTAIASSCCGHPAWYRHAALADGWTKNGVPLGHSLGGNGLEAAIDWTLDPLSAPFSARGRFIFRDRGSENLYSPDLRGQAIGADLAARAYVGRISWETALSSEVGPGPDRWALTLRIIAAL